MRFFAVGQEAIGVIAIGQQATGIVAVGQLATGVIAVGQLARGVIVVGQLAVGLVALGQLAVGVAWAAGMVGIGGSSGGLLVLAPFGKVSFASMRRLRPKFVPRRPFRAWMVLPFIAACGVWVSAAAIPLAHELGRVGGIFKEATPTTVPGPNVLR